MSRNFASTDRVICSSAPVTSAPISLSCWFKLGVTGTDQDLIHVGIAGTNANYFVLLKNAIGVISANTKDGTTEAFAVTSTTATDTTTWHHAAGVFAAANSRAAYLDGAGKGTNATSRTPSSPSRVVLGLRNDLTTNPYVGMLQQVSIWNATLSDADVTNLAAGVSPLLIQPANLQFYMPYLGRESTGNDVSLIGGITGTPTGTSFNASDPNIPIGNPSPAYQFMISRKAMSF